MILEKNVTYFSTKYLDSYLIHNSVLQIDGIFRRKIHLAQLQNGGYTIIITLLRETHHSAVLILSHGDFIGRVFNPISSEKFTEVLGVRLDSLLRLAKLEGVVVKRNLGSHRTKLIDLDAEWVHGSEWKGVPWCILP